MAQRFISVVADGNERVWINPELITRILRHGAGSTIYFDGVSGADALDRCRGPLNVRDHPTDIVRRMEQLHEGAQDRNSGASADLVKL